jgi:hypothetical protein
MNEIGVAEIALPRPVFFDAYAENRATGSFILIDPATNATLAAGMIRRGIADASDAARPRHKAALVLVAEADVAAIEDALLADDAAVVRTRIRDPRVLHALLAAGAVVLITGVSLADLAGEHAIDATGLAVNDVVHALRR